VAIADKVDTIAGCFGVGLIPTGSQDPYALRRGAVGVTRILLQHRLRLDLRQLVQEALGLLAEKVKADKAEVQEGIWAFFRQRMEGQLAEIGLDDDVVDAVLSASDRDVVDALGRGRALQGIRAGEEFQALVLGSKRVANILRDQEISGEPNPSLFQEKAEDRLFQVAQATRKKVVKSLPARAYERVLAAILELVGPIDEFFEHILVMEKDPQLRENRLRLLAKVRQSFLAMADTSKIVIREETDSPKEG
jgi:glycyl-tRNA synthetase beta chain